MKKLLILGTLCLLFAISVVGQSQKEWEKVQSLNSWNVYQQFILNYPDGKYTEEAKQKQSLLEKPAEVIKVENKVSTELPAEKKIVATPSKLTNNSNQIIIKGFGYTLNDNKLNKKELKIALMSHPESAIEYKKWKKQETVAWITLPFGFVLLTSGGDALDNAMYEDALNGEINSHPGPTAAILVGSALALTGIGFFYSSFNHSHNAISIYNSNHTTEYNNYQKLELGITHNGLRMVYRF